MSIETYRDYIYRDISDEDATYNKKNPNKMNLYDLKLIYQTSVKLVNLLPGIFMQSNKKLSELLEKYYVNENDRKNLGKFMTIIKEVTYKDISEIKEIHNWKDIYQIVRAHKWQVGNNQLYGNKHMWKKINLECKGKWFLMPEDMDTIYKLIIKGITSQSKKWFYKQLEAMFESKPSVDKSEIYYHDHIYKLLYLLDNDIKLYIEGTIFNENCVVDVEKTKQYKEEYEEKDNEFKKKLKENKRVYGPQMYSDVVKEFNKKVENSFGYHLIPNEIWNFKDKIDREIAEHVVKTHITKRNNPYLKYYMLSENFLGKIESSFNILPDEKVEFLQKSVELYEKDITNDEKLENKFPLNYIKHVMGKEEIWEDMYEKIKKEMSLFNEKPSARSIENEINEWFETRKEKNLGWPMPDRKELAKKIWEEINGLEYEFRPTSSKLRDKEKEKIQKHILGEIQKKVDDQMKRAKEIEEELKNQTHSRQQSLRERDKQYSLLREQQQQLGKVDRFPRWGSAQKDDVRKFIWPYEDGEITVIPFSFSSLKDIFENKKLEAQFSDASVKGKDKLNHNGRNFSQPFPKLVYTGATIGEDEEKKLQKNDEIINFKETDRQLHEGYKLTRDKICMKINRIIKNIKNKEKKGNEYDLTGALNKIIKDDKFNLVIYRPPEGTGVGNNGGAGLLLDIKLRF